MRTLKPLGFDGTYEDERGVEQIQWLLLPVENMYGPSFELLTVIRGVEVTGCDFDGLDPDDEEAAAAAGVPSAIIDCRLTGRGLPCQVTVSGNRRTAMLDFVFDYYCRSGSDLELSLDVDGAVYRGASNNFENTLWALQSALPPEIQLSTCLTCRWSGFMVGSAGMTGMRCCRDAKEQHLAARTKSQHFQVPVAELVPEFHSCEQYEPERGTS